MECVFLKPSRVSDRSQVSLHQLRIHWKYSELSCVFIEVCKDARKWTSGSNKLMAKVLQIMTRLTGYSVMTAYSKASLSRLCNSAWPPLPAPGSISPGFLPWQQNPCNQLYKDLQWRSGSSFLRFGGMVVMRTFTVASAELISNPVQPPTPPPPDCPCSPLSPLPTTTKPYL